MKLKRNTPKNKKSQKEILLQQVDEPVKESAEQEEFQSFFCRSFNQTTKQNGRDHSSIF